MKKRMLCMLLVLLLIGTFITPLDVQAAAIKKVKITNAKNNSDNAVTLKFKKVNKAKGYQITYATDKAFKKNRKSITVRTNTKTIKSLKTGTTYYFKVRAYRLNASRKRIYGNYSSIKKVNISRGIRKIALNKQVSGTLTKGNPSHTFKIKHNVSRVYGIKLECFSNYGKKYEWILVESTDNPFFDGYLSSTDATVSKRTIQNPNGWFVYTQQYSEHRSTGTYNYTISVPEYMFTGSMRNLKLKYKLTLVTSIEYPYN